MRLRVFLLLILSFIANVSLASEVIELEGIFVRGNQEQPKVLFIIPWQTDAELNGLKQEIKPDLTPTDDYLDYFKFKRQVDSHQQAIQSSSDS
ncbi:hypothetical protein [Litoribacillus peritrichatus]|uniref:Uncharacterized protein n=1 Tax=Litoribacillus peritrichatus TaxID=718191 RepID=A0ABP7N5N7_9GAMM